MTIPREPIVPTIAETLAGFVTRLDYEAIPATIRAQAKLHLLDSVGIALAASSFDYARKACAGLAALGGGDYTVIGMPAKLSLRDAALMNGMLVHGLEFDDTSIRGRIHPSAFSVPCALGVGAFAQASGKELLSAYIAGVECAVRIGMAARGGFSPAGFNAVGIVGGFGSVLIAGKLLGLDAARLATAQGIVYSTTSGNREFATTDSWTKRLEAGWPCVCGITAAMLAKEGFVGSRTPYEGKFGLFKTYLNAPAAAADIAAIPDKLGEHWEFAGMLIKMLPSCFFNHALINSTLLLVNTHDLRAADIRGIRALVPAAAVDTVCEPRAAKLAPGDIAAAEFSAYFSVACAAVRRQFTLNEMSADTLNGAGIRAMATKVDYAVDPQSNFPQHYSGGVEITMADGRCFSAREDINSGSLEKPIAPSAIEAKFLDNAQRALPRQHAEAVRDMILNIELCDDVNALTAQLGTV